MVQRNGYNRGEVCWTDVQTPDVAAAKSFYAAVFGWRYEDLPTPDGRSYSKAFLEDDLVTAIAPQPQAQGAASAPAQWNVYLAADDARAIAEETPLAGGTVQFGPEEIADTGTMVFVEPPGGGATGVWQAGTHPGCGRYGEPGAISWAELVTAEPAAAVGFFQRLFGHDVTEYPQDDGGTYTTLMVDGAEVAGVAPAPGLDEEQGLDEEAEPDEKTRPDEELGWQVYFGVSSVSEAVLAAVAAGAEVLVEPEFAEDGGSIATLKDPQGGVFSVLEV
ncbi:VOC family protein [Arthrobacter sp. ZGTC131]|uniref:VOC family protein n=1 Tax=Arthrobacter sp. ZGTC131 TaxID=2058898 RepID=UPI000CE309E7|nr:VOC family protein [Arthrobacter sp. ZGTC131]